MLKSLRIRFLILLLSVSIIAAAAAFLLRELMIRDFKEYMEGELEDRVYWVTADLEAMYEKHGGWAEGFVSEDVIWAMMIGLEIRVLDVDGSLIMDTKKALGSLSPLIKKRVVPVSEFRSAGARSGGFVPYPLFLRGKEIGRIEVKFLRPVKEDLFVERSNRFLILSLTGLGGIAILLSIVFSRRLTTPLKRLAAAAESISKGDLGERVEVSGDDELSSLTRAFNAMAEALEVQESLRKRIISNAAHELRTPLGAIRGELEGMIDGLIPVDREQLQSLHEEIGRLGNILAGVEELSQAEASVLSLNREHIDMNAFLKNIFERFRKLFLDKGISAELQCDDELRLNADPDRLSQVIVNLLDNALKATGENGYIRLKAAQGEHHVAIEVEDSGCGIEEKDLPFIFERFYRSSGGGLGLGLTIVREIVEAHGGKIEVRSEPGRGSVFTVYLPS